jgi:hypothetical protein
MLNHVGKVKLGRVNHVGSCTLRAENWKSFPSRNGQGYKLRQQTLHVQRQSQPASHGNVVNLLR